MKKVYNCLVLALLLGYISSLKGQTAGNLTFTFTAPKHTVGNYVSDGRYVLAIWIESCTPCGTTAGTSTFVKTRVRNWGGNTTDHLPTWVSKSGSNTVNATTGATLTVFTSQTVSWDGTNVSSTNVTDGSYRVAVQETWGHGNSTVTRYFPFTKGTAIDSQTPTADTNLTNITLVWSPTLINESFSQGPKAIVYPNPTKGIFNIDFNNNNIKNIKVVTVLGELIYTENIELASAITTKKIDLTNFANGIYFVNISDENATSSYKIILEK